MGCVCVEVSRESELVQSFRQTLVRCGDSGGAVPGGRRKSNPCVLPLFEGDHWSWMEGVNLRRVNTTSGEVFKGTEQLVANPTPGA